MEVNKIITSFTQVDLTSNQKYLILCDIDETVLYYPNCTEICKEMINDMNIFGKNYEKELRQLKLYYRIITRPNHTDLNGFNDLLNRICDKKGKLVFITSRHIDSEKLTKKQLKEIGINPEDFEIYYVGTKISKGEYIKNNFNLLEWETIIFIDDNEEYIESVKKLHPQIICYKFKI